MDKLIKCVDNDEYVIGVLLDFSKAFDTVDHASLLLKNLAMVWEVLLVRELFERQTPIFYL